MNYALWAVLLVGLGSAAVAQKQAGFSTAYNTCVDRSGGVTATLRDCAEAEGKRIDAALNREYRLAMARQPSRAAKDRLRVSQRAWLRTRYDHCAAEARELEGGTLWLLAMDGCGLAADADRVAWLKRYNP